jgi:uncharacterized protein (TIGR03084 family)
MHDICKDLGDEHSALDAMVRDLPAAAWDTPTAAEGWSIRDSVSHLWFFDGTATMAATDAEAFAKASKALLATTATGADPSVDCGRAVTPPKLLGNWREGRAALLAALSSLDPKARVPWYGPAMSAKSFATARLMETWAHGQDVADALGLLPVATDRLRHVAHIGVTARPYSYVVNQRELPLTSVRVELEAPSGEQWSWGDEASDHRVRGNALEFCLVVTQRRHLDDTSLAIEGADAIEWMSFAQAFAGGAGPGREPGRFG